MTASLAARRSRSRAVSAGGDRSRRWVTLHATQAFSEFGEDRVPNGGELVHKRMEFSVADDQEANDPIGTHGGGPRATVEQGDLAEEIARMELGNRAVPVEDAHVTVEHDEEFVSDAALLGEHLVHAHFDLIGELSEPFELALAHAGEHRDPPQVVKLLVSCHARQSTMARKGNPSNADGSRNDAGPVDVLHRPTTLRNPPPSP